jgi:hypothetical protein
MLYNHYSVREDLYIYILMNIYTYFNSVELASISMRVSSFQIISFMLNEKLL